MEILEKLFGSMAKVKVMRLFLFNPEQVFQTSDVVYKAKVNSASARRELGVLEKMHLVKRKAARSGRGSTWVLNSAFPFFSRRP